MSDRLVQFGMRLIAVGLIATVAAQVCSRAAQAQVRSRTEIVPQTGHTQFGIWSVAVSPDGSLVLTGGADGTVKLWDAGTGQLLRSIRGHLNWIGSVAFSPDGSRVLSGSADDAAKLWEAATGQPLQVLKQDALVRSVAFSPDGKQFVAAGDNERLKYWSSADGKLLRNVRAGKVLSLAFSPDGGSLLTGHFDQSIKLWSAATGQLSSTIQKADGYGGDVCPVAFSGDGARLAAACNGKTIRVWDATSKQLLHAIEAHSSYVNSLAFSRDGTRLLSGGDKVMKLWDAASGRLLRTLEADPREVKAVAFSPDGRQLLSGGSDNIAKLWDGESGQLLRTFSGGSHSVRAAAFSPSGALIATGGDDRALKLWDAGTGQLRRTFRGHLGQVKALAFSPDGTRLVSGSSDGTLKLWSPLAEQSTLTISTGKGRGVEAVAFSPDGGRLLSCDGSKVHMWDTTDGHLIREFDSPANSVAFSSTGALILSGGDDDLLKLWDAETGSLLKTFKGHDDHVISVAFSPDGTRLLSGSADNTLRLWDATTGRLLRKLIGGAYHIDPTNIKEVQKHSGQNSIDYTRVAFSADGKRLLSGSWDGTIKIWDAEKGTLLQTLQGHSSEVNAVAFSPDLTRVISGSDDSTARLWSVDKGRLLATMLARGDGESLTLTPEGFFNASSPKAGSLLSIVRGYSAYTVDQMWQSLFNPDLVREALAGDPGGEVQASAAVVNLDKVLDSGKAPRVSLAKPSPGAVSSDEVITAEATIESQDGGAGRIEWRVNGLTVGVVSRLAGDGKVRTAIQRIALDPGDNVIEVIAYNERNALGSVPARTTIKFTGAAEKAKPSLHVLAIGINAYVDQGWVQPGSDFVQFAPLALAVKDATTFGADMKRAAGNLYQDVKVTYALDADATKANLELIVDKLAREIHPRDTFILFAAAHGATADGRFYLIPRDYQSGPDALARNGVGQDRLQDWLANRIKARKAIILLDTCESGALIAGHLRSRADAPASEAAVGRLHEATGRPVLTAAATGRPALEGYKDHGVFTWALLDALRHGDTNGNGMIELSELVAHVQDRVPELSAELQGTGRTAIAVSGSTNDRQSARFGSRGEDFVLAMRLR